MNHNQKLEPILMENTIPGIIEKLQSLTRDCEFLSTSKSLFELAEALLIRINRGSGITKLSPEDLATLLDVLELHNFLHRVIRQRNQRASFEKRLNSLNIKFNFNSNE